MNKLHSTYDTVLALLETAETGEAVVNTGEYVVVIPPVEGMDVEVNDDELIPEGSQSAENGDGDGDQGQITSSARVVERASDSECTDTDESPVAYGNRSRADVAAEDKQLARDKAVSMCRMLDMVKSYLVECDKKFTENRIHRPLFRLLTNL